MTKLSSWPLCPWDFVPVAKQGFTCGIDCYSAWILHWAEQEQPQSDLLIIPDDTNVPLSLANQPWYLHEFPDDDKPKVEQ